MHPPFPFRLRRKGNGPCTVQRKRRFGAKRHVVPYLLMRGGPSKRPWEVESASALGAGPDLLKFSAVRPRRTAFVRRRVQDRFDLLLPAAAALPTSNRHSRYHPGSAERSGERGKRRWSNPTTTHERSTHAPKCGEALLCSPRRKRTRHNSPGLPPKVRTNQPPYMSKPDRQGGIWTKAVFFWTVAALSKRAGGTFVA